MKFREARPASRKGICHPLPHANRQPVTKGFAMPEIISRKSALAKGLKRYFTGMPCIRGHISLRLVSNGDCIECRPLQFSRWRNQNLAADKLKKRAYYARTREKQIAAARKWIADNPSRHAEINRAVRHKRRGAEGSFNSHDVVALYAFQKARCAEASCKKDITQHYHIDHIMPLKLGGTNWPSNLQLLCPSCNQKKHAKHPIDWAQQNGRLL